MAYLNLQCLKGDAERQRKHSLPVRQTNTKALLAAAGE